MKTIKTINNTIRILFVYILVLSLIALMPAICKGQYYENKITPKEKVFVKKMPSKKKLWIFVMAGQSNMEGRGKIEPQDTLINKRIIYLDENQNWCYAKEPLHTYSKLYDLDCGKAFAETILENVPRNVTIGLIPCAVGGTSVEEWLNDDKRRGVCLYSNFKNKVEIAQKSGKIKGILWHQGESDSSHKERRESYTKNLEKLINLFRKDIGNDKLPFVMGEICIFKDLEPEKKENRKSINTSLHAVNRDFTGTGIIYTQDLNHRGDILHFETLSVREMGIRFAKMMIDLL